MLNIVKRNKLLIMKQVNKSFDTVKVFRDIKTKLSKKLIDMKDE